VQNAQGLGFRVLATEEDLRLVFLKGDMLNSDKCIKSACPFSVFFCCTSAEGVVA
jgi:hypothetical protein